MRKGVLHAFSLKTNRKDEARKFAENMKIVKRCNLRESALKMVDILFPAEHGAQLALADAWSVYIELAKSTGMDGVTGRTMDTRRRVFARFLKWVASRPGVEYVNDVDGSVAAGFAAHLTTEKNRHGKPISAKTRANVIAELSTVCTMLSKASGGISDVWQGLMPRAERGERKEAFTKEQEKAVMAAAEKVGKEWPLACTIARHTGLRYGDVARLGWESIDMAARTISLTPEKTKRHGVTVLLPLADALYAALSAVPKKSRTGYLLPIHAELYGNPSSSAYKKLNFREVLDAAGLGEEFSFHSWRHTFRSRLADAGVDMETAKRLCGHTQDETSRHYDHAAHLKEYRKAIAAAAKI